MDAPVRLRPDKLLYESPGALQVECCVAQCPIPPIRVIVVIVNSDNARNSHGVSNRISPASASNLGTKVSVCSCRLVTDWIRLATRPTTSVAARNGATTYSANITVDLNRSIARSGFMRRSGKLKAEGGRSRQRKIGNERVAQAPKLCTSDRTTRCQP